MFVGTGILAVIVYLAIGGLSGYLAGKIMGGEFSLRKNILLGLLGSFVGEFLFRLIGLNATSLIGNVIVSVVGACVCIWAGRKLFQ